MHSFTHGLLYYSEILSQTSNILPLILNLFTASSAEEQVAVSAMCRRNGAYFISAATPGLFGQVFCDFGSQFEVVDTDGENPQSMMIASITKEEKSVVTCLDESRHGLEDGSYVTFTEVQGMTELNGCAPKKVTVSLFNGIALCG